MNVATNSASGTSVTAVTPTTPVVANVGGGVTSQVGGVTSQVGGATNGGEPDGDSIKMFVGQVSAFLKVDLIC